jgi:dCMP deaminase
MKFNKALMGTAVIWSKESTCKRNQVGAVIARNGRIVSTGYNGTISGASNTCEELCQTCSGKGCERCQGTGLVSKNTVVHAETNAILFAAKNGIQTNGCSIYITLSPCIECAKMIVQAGINEVYYKEQYRNTDGVEFLKQNGVIIKQI